MEQSRGYFADLMRAQELGWPCLELSQLKKGGLVIAPVCAIIGL